MIQIVKDELQRRFEEYNRFYFNEKLKKPRFKFIMAKKPYGSCHVNKKRCEIWISKYVKWTDETLKNVLIHEMIHQYVYEVIAIVHIYLSIAILSIFKLYFLFNFHLT